MVKVADNQSAWCVEWIGKNIFSVTSSQPITHLNWSAAVCSDERGDYQKDSTTRTDPPAVNKIKERRMNGIPIDGRLEY